jgi:microcystin-dependent protein
MSDPFLGEVRLFGTPTVPKGWLKCEGQTLPIAQNQALFSLLGTQYGGDGVTTFKLPDLRGRVPIGVGPYNPQGQIGGEENHTLTVAEMPAHNHFANASTAEADQTALTNNFWASKSTISLYAPGADTTMAPNALDTAGSNMPHPNMQPYLAVSFCIAIQGIYPSRP